MLAATTAATDTRRMESGYLTNHFLIAMPQLHDPNFSRSVTYICEHTAEGALGIVINRPLDMCLGDILAHMEIDIEDERNARLPVHAGGPVHPERGFVLHRPVGDWESSLHVTGDIAVTTSRDVLEALARGQGPEQALIALGYAGWEAGQLEREMLENSWLSGPANPHILFEIDDHERWRAAAALLGVDLDKLSGEAGHA